MKVMAFMGSPRRGGNTEVLVDRFLEGAGSKGAETEKVNLYECGIEPCQGCYQNCWTSGNDCTRWNDEMKELFTRMLASDLLLFASPVYMGCYTSQMVAFFERCIPFMWVDLETKKIVENRGKGKKAVIALVHDSPDPEMGDLPFKVFERTVTQNFQMEIVGRLQVPDVRDEGDIERKQESLKEAYELGAKLCG